MIVKSKDTESGTTLVTFLLPASIWAESVHLVGDFNGWSRHSHPLALSEDNWQITLELERGKFYHFRYLLDGAHWCNDCSVGINGSSPLGGHDSVLET